MYEKLKKKLKAKKKIIWNILEMANEMKTFSGILYWPVGTSWLTTLHILLPIQILFEINAFLPNGHFNSSKDLFGNFTPNPNVIEHCCYLGFFHICQYEDILLFIIIFYSPGNYIYLVKLAFFPNHILPSPTNLQLKVFTSRCVDFFLHL